MGFASAVTLAAAAGAAPPAAKVTAKPATSRPVQYLETQFGGGVGGQLGGPIDQVRLIEGTVTESKGTGKGDPAVVHTLHVDRVDSRRLATPVVRQCDAWQAGWALPGGTFRLLAVEKAYSSPNPSDPKHLLKQVAGGGTDLVVQTNRGVESFFTELTFLGSVASEPPPRPTTVPAHFIPYAQMRTRGVLGKLEVPLNQVCVIEGSATGQGGLRDKDGRPRRMLFVERVDGKPLYKAATFEFVGTGTVTPPEAGKVFKLVAVEQAGSGTNPADPNRLLDLLPPQDPARIPVQAKAEPAFLTTLTVYGPAKPG